MAGKQTKTARKSQAGWRLPADLLKQVRRDAVERELRQSDVVLERLAESFARRPVGRTTSARQ